MYDLLDSLAELNLLGLNAIRAQDPIPSNEALDNALKILCRLYSEVPTKYNISSDADGDIFIGTKRVHIVVHGGHSPALALFRLIIEAPDLPIQVTEYPTVEGILNQLTIGHFKRDLSTTK